MDQKTLIPIKMVNPIEEQKRQERLEEWYERDGRNKKTHSMYGLYTGLADKYKNEGQVDA